MRVVGSGGPAAYPGPAASAADAATATATTARRPDRALRCRGAMPAPPLLHRLPTFRHIPVPNARADIASGPPNPRTGVWKEGRKGGRGRRAGRAVAGVRPAGAGRGAGGSARHPARHRRVAARPRRYRIAPAAISAALAAEVAIIVRPSPPVCGSMGGCGCGCGCPGCSPPPRHRRAAGCDRYPGACCDRHRAACCGHRRGACCARHPVGCCGHRPAGSSRRRRREAESSRRRRREAESSRRRRRGWRGPAAALRGRGGFVLPVRGRGRDVLVVPAVRGRGRSCLRRARAEWSRRREPAGPSLPRVPAAWSRVPRSRAGSSRRRAGCGVVVTGARPAGGVVGGAVTGVVLGVLAAAPPRRSVVGRGTGVAEGRVQRRARVDGIAADIDRDVHRHLDVVTGQHPGGTLGGALRVGVGERGAAVQGQHAGRGGGHGHALAESLSQSRGLPARRSGKAGPGTRSTVRDRPVLSRGSWWDARANLSC